jgi:hypothetical protein
VSGALGDDSEEADAGGNSMWHLYAEYGRDNAFKGVLGILGTCSRGFSG